jgi:hypothetical protein
MSEPTPELFVDTAFAYQKTAAIKAAIGVGLFTAIGTESKTAAEIAKAIGASPKGIRILHGARFLEKTWRSLRIDRGDPGLP